MFHQSLIAAAAAVALIAPAAAIANPGQAESAAVAATATGTAAATASPAAANGRDKRYCIRETLTGSRIARDFCKTRTDWLRQGLDPIAKY